MWKIFVLGDKPFGFISKFHFEETLGEWIIEEFRKTLEAMCSGKDRIIQSFKNDHRSQNLGNLNPILLFVQKPFLWFVLHWSTNLFV